MIDRNDVVVDDITNSIKRVNNDKVDYVTKINLETSGLEHEKEIGMTKVFDIYDINDVVCYSNSPCKKTMESIKNGKESEASSVFVQYFFITRRGAKQNIRNISYRYMMSRALLLTA